MNELLSVKNLTKTFFELRPEKTPSFILDNISFNLKKGGKIALIGPDGSGKTTLLRLLSGLLLPDEYCLKKEINSILIENIKPYKNHEKIKKIIGYM
ncbi:MAG: ATP-binding cassette domain-containing protein, partial [Candidatus Gastranaerophilales bacterium]|nr:ATP-binding cassette domain-containing protein [Candidatus Gastranaerophilales bacterium]